MPKFHERKKERIDDTYIYVVKTNDRIVLDNAGPDFIKFEGGKWVDTNRRNEGDDPIVSKKSSLTDVKSNYAPFLSLPRWNSSFMVSIPIRINLFEPGIIEPFMLQTKWRMIYRACVNEINQNARSDLSSSPSLSLSKHYVNLWSICCRNCVSSSGTRVILVVPSRAFIRSSSNHYVPQADEWRIHSGWRVIAMSANTKEPWPSCIHLVVHVSFVNYSSG